MSSRTLRKKQESCIYRLNRAALMRMEEGRRKALTKEEGYYKYDRSVCIQVDRGGAEQPSIQSQDELLENEGDTAESEEMPKLKTRGKHHKARNRGNTSIISFKPRTNNDRPDKRLPSMTIKKTSRTGHREFESVRRIPSDISRKRKYKVNKRAAKRPVAPPLSASSAGQCFLGTAPSYDLKRASYPPKVSWASSQPGIAEPGNEIGSEEEILMSSTLHGSMTRSSRSPAIASTPKRSLPTSPKGPPDPSLKEEAADEEVYSYLTGSKKHSVSGLSRGLPPHGLLAKELSQESFMTKLKRRSVTGSSTRRMGPLRPNMIDKRIYFKPLTSTVTMTSDQEEVISKWRERLGTSSPGSPPASLNSSVIASSTLRDSQIMRVQGTPTASDPYSSPLGANYLVPEKDSPETSLVEDEFQKLLDSMNIKRSKEISTADEERELFLMMEMERSKRQIFFLEELAREKLEKLEAIKWKKKKALEEEAILNGKLEKLLTKIQELRESDSFVKMLNKQTQVFTTKWTRTNSQ